MKKAKTAMVIRSKPNKWGSSLTLEVKPEGISEIKK
jgi:hypothetical protein